MPTAPCLTFLSDFGTRESYVAAVKGVILSTCPGLNIVDITHEIRSHDLLEAAFTLSCAFSHFPSMTVHLVVVDPGVGSSRRGIIATSLHHLFVAPDNGVLSLVFDQVAITRVYSIEAEHYYNQPVSPTFHGRDVFGPVAAQLARGVEADKFGPAIDDFIRLNLPAPKRCGDRQAEGIVLHVDRFGNVVTSLKPSHLEGLFGENTVPKELALNGKSATKHCRFYAEAAEGELVSVVGGSGYYELAVLKKSAAGLLEARRGQKVVVSVQEPKLYSEKVKQLVAEMPNAGELPEASHSAEGENPICGDIIRLQFKIDRGVVTDCRFQAAGCAAAIAAAAQIAQLCQGRTLDACDAITVAELVASIDGLPPHKLHGAELAVATLRRALGR